MYTQMDLAAATVYFRKKAEALGVVPLAVYLCPPGQEHVGFERFAADFLLEVAKARHEGREVPSIHKWPLRREEDYNVIRSEN